MTITYDPHDPLYRDEADVRGELSRVFAVCQGCQRCAGLCGAFPTLFDLLDRFDDHDPGRLTPYQQDLVTAECWHCNRCVIGCPGDVDVPRLVLRAEAMRYAARQVPLRRVLAMQVRARARRGGRAWRLAGRSTGLRYARQRFSTWFRRRGAAPATTTTVTTTVTTTTVALVPTCIVEHERPSVGRDLVALYDRQGIGCALGDVACCGAPWLDAGDVERFTKAARRNVAALAAEIRRGRDVVVPEPRCSRVLRQEYPRHAAGPDAELVAAHTYDAVEHLARHGASVPPTAAAVTYHPSGSLLVQDVGMPVRDLLASAGADVRVEPAGDERSADTVTPAGGPPQAAIAFLARACGVPADPA